MTFVAFQAKNDGTDFSFEGRDEDAGILGRHPPSETPPVVTAETLEDLKRKARAFLGKEPDAVLYLADTDNHVYEIMINEKHHAAVESVQRRTAISIALLIFCVTCLLGAGSLGSLLCFVGISTLYALILRFRLYNEIEGAVVCLILLFVIIMLIPVLQRAK